jgi:hypothetical protein
VWVGGAPPPGRHFRADGTDVRDDRVHPGKGLQGSVRQSAAGNPVDCGEAQECRPTLRDQDRPFPRGVGWAGGLYWIAEGVPRRSLRPSAKSTLPYQMADAGG